MFKIEFATGNAAFDDESDGNASDEINRILIHIGNMVSLGYTEGHVFDVNGNKVGSWEFTRDEG